jgi:hypothetical protein
MASNQKLKVTVDPIARDVNMQSNLMNLEKKRTDANIILPILVVKFAHSPVECFLVLCRRTKMECRF